jgi:hypothetical protein
MPPRCRLLVPLLLLGVALSGCGRREPPEDTKARAQAAFLRQQIVDLEAMVADPDSHATEDKVAVGVDEKLVASLIDASLPRTLEVGGRARITLQSARAYFRGNRSAVLIAADLASLRSPDTHVSVELGGSLGSFRIVDGELSARAQLLYATVMESSAGDLATGVADRLLQDNLALIQEQIPPIVIPVSLEQDVRIGALEEGPVAARGGVLPISVGVADVLPMTERIWILLDVKAGPWKALPAKARTPAPSPMAPASPAAPAPSASPAPKSKATP